VDALGAPVVTPAEVLAAIHTAPPGRSPGADSLPTELYQHYAPTLAPVLAAVFTAFAATDRAPAGFLDGVITSFFKDQDPPLPAHDRPITLLDTDYRTLARVLARRLLPVLGDTIDPVQTAFLQQRRISDSVLLLQLLPALLRAESRSCAVVFLDFQKAYDTVDRVFLLECLDALGVGPGCLAWVRRLLQGTRSAALVNGHLSGWVPITAGVRQGCPAAPLLYLAPGQALLSWLQHEAIGISLADLRLTASQYADDCTPLLRDAADVPRFLAAMDTFHAASGQQLNLRKVKLLPLPGGPRASPAAAPPPACPTAASAPPLPPAPVAAAAPLAAPDAGLAPRLAVVPSASTLGITFTAGAPGPYPVDLDRVYGRLQRAATLPLSAFGRAFAASGYAISRVLYHMEFVGFPPPGLRAALQANTAAIVDRRCPPAAHQARANRVPAGAGLLYLALPPSAGGFGLLPLEAHVRARHAVLAVRGLAGACGLLPSAPQWPQLLRALLRHGHPAAHRPGPGGRRPRPRPAAWA
jgi:hypothetical protein